jgi:hypothetical protein
MDLPVAHSSDHARGQRKQAPDLAVVWPEVVLDGDTCADLHAGGLWLLMVTTYSPE